jgi:hypothetical protein
MVKNARKLQRKCGSLWEKQAFGSRWLVNDALRLQVLTNALAETAVLRVDESALSSGWRPLRARIFVSSLRGGPLETG